MLTSEGHYLRLNLILALFNIKKGMKKIRKFSQLAQKIKIVNTPECILK